MDGIGSRLGISVNGMEEGGNGLADAERNPEEFPNIG
jgi:hypothetical protein